MEYFQENRRELRETDPTVELTWVHRGGGVWFGYVHKIGASPYSGDAVGMVRDWRAYINMRKRDVVFVPNDGQEQSFETVTEAMEAGRKNALMRGLLTIEPGEVAR